MIYFRIEKFEDEFNITGKGKVLVVNIKPKPFNGVNPFNIGDVIRDYKGKDYEIIGVERYRKLFSNLVGDNVGLLVKEFNDKNE